MASPMLVTGGTGTLGNHVVRRLREGGRPVRVLSRNSHESREDIDYVAGDLATGEGVEAAVAGVEVILHLAGSARGDDTKTRNLVQAALSQPRKPHLVYISVVGADRPTFGYFAAKLASEEIIVESGLPWTILRATQFHDLMLKVGQGMARLPVLPTPSGFRFQPIDADEVAARLVELALGAPAGRVPDIAGPQVYEMADLIRAYLRASNRRRLILPIRMPGRAAREFRAGANLAPDRTVGRRTWEEFLAERGS